MSSQIQSCRCILLLFVIAAAFSVASSRDQLSTRECEALGFTGLALCSDCNTFAEYVKDQELVSDCLKCCTEDSDDETSKFRVFWLGVSETRRLLLKSTQNNNKELKVTYTGAVLEVCMRKLVFYPEIVGFIEEEKDQFPSVKVKYVFNSPPKLIMLDEDGQEKDTIRIDNWKREHVLQFLRGKLKTALAE